MKGIILFCLKSLIIDNFGKEKWEEILETSELDPFFTVDSTEDVDDSIVLKVVGSTCKVLNISLEQAADAFGDYWVNVIAPKIYKIYYDRLDSSKEFILKMDEIHKKVTVSIPEAKPPSFEYNWKDEKTLIVKYISHRNLIDFVVGLIKGVGKYFDEDLKVNKLSDDEVEVVFP